MSLLLEKYHLQHTCSWHFSFLSRFAQIFLVKAEESWLITTVQHHSMHPRSKKLSKQVKAVLNNTETKPIYHPQSIYMVYFCLLCSLIARAQYLTGSDQTNNRSRNIDYESECRLFFLHCAASNLLYTLQLTKPNSLEYDFCLIEQVSLAIHS